MVKIINHGLKPLIRRIGTGQNVVFPPNEEVEVTDEVLIETIKSKKKLGDLQIKDSIGQKNVGGGIKTGIRPLKRRGRPPKSKVQEKVDNICKGCGKSKCACKKEAKPKSLKKPKGLKKKKGIGIDLDGDGKVDVIVGKDD